MCSVVGHRVLRPTKRARENSILAGFQDLRLGDGSFKATFEDSFGESKRKSRERVVKRIATVTAKQLKVTKCFMHDRYNCILKTTVAVENPMQTALFPYLCT